MITGAGHHIFADKPELFNRYVNEACVLSDSNSLPIPKKIEKVDETDEPQVDDQDIENILTETTEKSDKKSFVKTST